MEKLSFEELPNQVANLTEEIAELKNLLIKQSSSETVEQIIDAKQCSKLLNMTIHTLYGYTQRKEIPFNKKGKKLIFIRSEIIDWVKSGRFQTKKELEDSDDTYLKKKK